MLLHTCWILQKCNYVDRIGPSKNVVAYMLDSPTKAHFWSIQHHATIDIFEESGLQSNIVYNYIHWKKYTYSYLEK